MKFCSKFLTHNSGGGRKPPANAAGEAMQRTTLLARNCLALCALYALLLACATLPAPALAEEILLHDEFDAGSLDMSKWEVAAWTMGGKTAFGTTPALASENGTSFARFSLQTYNPSYPGSRVLATAIYSDTLFSRQTGLVCEARIRVTSAAQPGQVAAFFLYETYSGASDEIDFEFLTKQSTNKVLLTNWNDWESGGTRNDGIHHADYNPTVAGLDFSDWTTVKILWLPTETRWIINGTEVWRTSQALPDQAMKLHLNLWAPDASWSAAYDAGLAPVADAGSNTAYYYDVDYVKVTRYTGSEAPALPGPAWIGLGLLLGIMGLAVLGRA